jgi:hypothetical protein
MKVRTTGEEMHLKPMNAADRRTIHRLATDEGLETESIGEGRDRHIVLKPGRAVADEISQEPQDEPAEVAETSEDAKE